MTQAVTKLPAKSVVVRRPTRPPTSPPPGGGNGLGQDHLELSSKATRPTKPPAAPPEPPEPPLPTVAATNEEAITLALEGKRVWVPSGRGFNEDFKLTKLDEGQGVDIAIGERKFRMLGADQAPATLAREFAISREVSSRLDTKPAAYVSVPATATEYMVPTDAEGKRPELTVVPLPDQGDVAHYQITLGKDALDFGVPKDLDVPVAVSTAAALFQRLPAHLRPDLQAITLVKGANPQDAYWSQTYHMEMVSAATAGNGAITFFHGLDDLTAGYFRHESGHVIGQFYSESNHLYPEGWEAAAKDDGNAVSDYGTKSLDEDFAESWDHYMTARNAAANGDPKPLEDFLARYPHRSPFLAGIFDDTLKPKKVASPAKPVAAAGSN